MLACLCPCPLPWTVCSEEIESDVTAECSKLGPLDGPVRVYKNHPEGVVGVKFKTGDAVAATVIG